eukprot:2183427-Amphidinium_carterae.1
MVAHACFMAAQLSQLDANFACMIFKMTATCAKSQGRGKQMALHLLALLYITAGVCNQAFISRQKPR